MAHRILCVDDHPMVLSGLRWMLESNEFLVTTADSAMAALASANEPFDVAVLDYSLPDMDGAALAVRLKSSQPKLPMILFSGNADIPVSSLHHFSAVLSKGSPMTDLLTTLDALIQRNSTAAE